VAHGQVHCPNMAQPINGLDPSAALIPLFAQSQCVDEGGLATTRPTLVRPEMVTFP